MIIGVGTDIIEIARIQRLIEKYGKKFLDRIYTPQEQDYCERFSGKAANYAARFAAKEALVKAFGTGFRDGIAWTDIEVFNDRLGKPGIIMPESMVGESRVCLSMSHCRDYAIAYVIIEKS